LRHLTVQTAATVVVVVAAIVAVAFFLIFWLPLPFRSYQPIVVVF